MRMSAKLEKEASCLTTIDSKLAIYWKVRCSSAGRVRRNLRIGMHEELDMPFTVSRYTLGSLISNNF